MASYPPPARDWATYEIDLSRCFFTYYIYLYNFNILRCNKISDNVTRIKCKRTCRNNDFPFIYVTDYRLLLLTATTVGGRWPGVLEISIVWFTRSFFESCRSANWFFLLVIRKTQLRWRVKTTPLLKKLITVKDDGEEVTSTCCLNIERWLFDIWILLMNVVKAFFKHL